MDETYPRRVADQLVVEIKAAMARSGIRSSRALAREIGETSQYVSMRLDGGNPRTGERVPLNVRDLAAIAQALELAPHELVRRAEIALRGGAVVAFPTRDDEIDALLTLNPAASEPDGDEDPDAEIEAQQIEP